MSAGFPMPSMTRVSICSFSAETARSCAEGGGGVELHEASDFSITAIISSRRAGEGEHVGWHFMVF